MARVTGPLHSDTASGTFAKSMTFATWKGRPYVRERVIPANPKSAMQTGIRAMMSFLATQWKAKVLPKWTGWTDDAVARGISTYNAFVSFNLLRWQLFKGPTQEYPAVETANAITTTQVVTGGAGFATVENTPSGAGDNWGIIIMRDTAEITAANWNLVVAVIEADAANEVSYVDTPLAAGTYHYRSAVLNTDGTIGTVCADSGEKVVT